MATPLRAAPGEELLFPGLPFNMAIRKQFNIIVEYSS